MAMASHLLRMWCDDPADPGRMIIEDPRVQNLAETIAPGSTLVDLAGWFSLNARLEPSGLVLRVHQPYVSRRRLLALQALRETLARRGLLVATAIEHHSRTIFRCGDRWAELEPYIEGDKPSPSPEAYEWLFGAIGRLSRELSLYDVHVPAPLVSAYAAPTTLLGWISVAESGFGEDEEALEQIRAVRRLVNQLRSHWIPATCLPQQVIHGDAKLGNVRITSNGDPVYLDFGFTAYRPRIHELAYSLVCMILGLDGHRNPGSFDWGLVPNMLDVFESASGIRLSTVERRALVPYMTVVPLHHAAIAGFHPDPEPALQSRLLAITLSEWLIGHPDAITR